MFQDGYALRTFARTREGDQEIALLWQHKVVHVREQFGAGNDGDLARPLLPEDAADRAPDVIPGTGAGKDDARTLPVRIGQQEAVEEFNKTGARGGEAIERRQPRLRLLIDLARSVDEPP